MTFESFIVIQAIRIFALFTSDFLAFFMFDYQLILNGSLFMAILVVHFVVNKFSQVEFVRLDFLTDFSINLPKVNIKTPVA